MAKVYIITAGDYSDFHVERAYATEAAAQAWIDNRFSSYDYGIEEYELLDDEVLPERIDMIQTAYTALPATWKMLQYRHGYLQPRLPEVNERYEKKVQYMADDHFYLKGFPDGAPECEVSHGVYRGIVVAVSIIGTDHERIRKVMSEKIAFIKSNSTLIEALRVQEEAEENDKQDNDSDDSQGKDG